MVAVRISPSTFRYADVSLKRDKEIVMEALKKKVYFDDPFKYADDSLKKDMDCILEAMKGNPYFYRKSLIINLIKEIFL